MIETNQKKTPRTDDVRLGMMLGRICDQYCKHPARLIKQEELEFRCSHCPLNDIVAYVESIKEGDSDAVDS